MSCPESTTRSLRLIRPSQWITQPWRNGGGITHEIHRDGPADAFRVRLSVAEVKSPGPFSRFAGVDRWITLLEGHGFTLHKDERSITIDTPFVPFSFSGDELIECSLVNGPVRDLNVMIDRSQARAAVRSIVVDAEARLTPPAHAHELYVFVFEGTLAIDGIALEHHVLAVGPAEAHTITGRGRALVVWVSAKT
jgi:environmental stress-induced protein Ves